MSLIFIVNNLFSEKNRDLICFTTCILATLTRRRVFQLLLKGYNPSQDSSEKFNHISISDVIEYWFGGDIHENYRMKWFPTGNKEIQENADQHIQTNFSSLLKSALDGKLVSWLNDSHGTVALIVILDQFSRHIFRKLPTDHIQRKQADNVAIEIAEAFTEKNGWDKDLSTPEFVFSLMPLRHSATLPRLQRVNDEIARRMKESNDEIELMLKFRKQTHRRILHLQDRAKAEASEEILERFPFQADESNIRKEKLVLATESFLARRKISSTQQLIVSLSGGVDSMVLLKILTILRSKDSPPILNIHVDYANRPESLLEAQYLQEWIQLLNHNASPEHPSCALLVRRVEEVQRGVTDREEYEKVTRAIRYDMYRDALQNSLKTSSTSNSSSMSDSNTTGTSKSSGSGDGGARFDITCSNGVMLGHHLDDLRENVISNVMRGCGSLSLSGMQEVGLSEGVPVWRPLLPFPKADVYDFAHKYGVPYFKDSTPSWSTRGKLRNLLLPLLWELYGEGSASNLSALAADSDEHKEMVHAFIYQAFISSIRYYPCGLTVDTTPYIQHPLAFWRAMLKHIMHSQHRGLVRDASVRSFVARLLRRAQKKIRAVEWVELRKAAASRITGDGQLVVFKTGVLRGEDEEKNWPSDWMNTKLYLSFSSSDTASSTIVVGGWTISCTLLTKSDYKNRSEEAAAAGEGKEEEYRETGHPPCELRGLRDGEDRWFLQGRIEYTLPAVMIVNHRSNSHDLTTSGYGQAAVAEEEEVLPVTPSIAIVPLLSVEHIVAKGGVLHDFTRGVDRRLRRGIPLLVPYPAFAIPNNYTELEEDENSLDVETEMEVYINFKLTYEEI